MNLILIWTSKLHRISKRRLKWIIIIGSYRCLFNRYLFWRFHRLSFYLLNLTWIVFHDLFHNRGLFLVRGSSCNWYFHRLMRWSKVMLDRTFGWLILDVWVLGLNWRFLRLKLWLICRFINFEMMMLDFCWWVERGWFNKLWWKLNVWVWVCKIRIPDSFHCVSHCPVTSWLWCWAT